MTVDSALMAKARRIRDLFEEKWVMEQMRIYHQDSPDMPSRDEQEGALNGQIDGHFDWVVPEFEWFTGMSKTDCQMMKEIADKVRDDLNSTNAGETSKLANLVQHWYGAAAVQYEERFITHFTTAVNNQKLLAMELGIAIHHVTEHIDQTRDAINGIADETVRQLEAMYTSEGPSGTEIAKIVIELVVATVAAAAATSGVLAPVLITGGLSVASEMLVDTKVNGDTIEKVQGSLVEKIGALKGQLTMFEDGLANSLATDNGELDARIGSDEQRRYLFPGETRLSDGFDPAEFHP